MGYDQTWVVHRKIRITSEMIILFDFVCVRAMSDSTAHAWADHEHNNLR